jgi:hypothetical protein
MTQQAMAWIGLGISVVALLIAKSNLPVVPEDAGFTTHPTSEPESQPRDPFS